MSKNEMRRYIILAVFLVVFSVIAFAAPFVKNGVFWISYFFGIVAIAFQVYIFRISFADGADTKSKFYGFPIARVCVIYICAQIVLSLIQMALAGHMKTWVSVIINILPIAFAIVGTVAADAAREEVERQEVQVKADVSMMKSLRSSASALESICQDDEIKKEVVKLAEEFRYSDPVSNEATEEIELKLKDLLDNLKNTLKSGNTEEISNLCTEITSVLAERNKLCALNK